MDWHTHINNIHWGGCCLTISLDLKGKDYQITSNPCLRNFGYYTATFRISIYDKKEDFASRIVNFPRMDSNIPANPAYGVCISQLVRYARICTSKVDFINRLRGLSLRLRQQGFETNLLQKSFFSRYGLIWCR